jgi:hypothetical protein
MPKQETTYRWMLLAPAQRWGFRGQLLQTVQILGAICMASLFWSRDWLPLWSRLMGSISCLVLIWIVPRIAPIRFWYDSVNSPELNTQEIWTRLVPRFRRSHSFYAKRLLNYQSRRYNKLRLGLLGFKSLVTILLLWAMIWAALSIFAADAPTELLFSEIRPELTRWSWHPTVDRQLKAQAFMSLLLVIMILAAGFERFRIEQPLHASRFSYLLTATRQLLIEWSELLIVLIIFVAYGFVLSIVSYYLISLGFIWYSNELPVWMSPLYLRRAKVELLWLVPFGLLTIYWRKRLELKESILRYFSFSASRIPETSQLRVDKRD